MSKSYYKSQSDADQDDYPLLAFDFIMENNGIHTQRSVHSMVELASTLGGLSRVLIPIIAILHGFLTKFSYQAIKIKYLSHKIQDIVNSHEFLKPGFKMKIFIRKRLNNLTCCC